MADNDDLLDYEDEEQTEQVVDGSGDVPAKKEVKGTYVSIHSSGFRDFLLKPEILRAIVDCGFEHPSEVQHECIPQAVLGMDILCQAKSGMGKTAVFVLATLQQLELIENQVYVLVMCHTRELAFQISKEYERFSKYMPHVKVGVFFGGLPIQKDEEVLKTVCPHIVVGTPGRILALVRNKKLNLKHLKHFILDECDKMLELLDMRRDVQEIFRSTPHSKQVMMFSATLSKEIRPVCKKFMQDVITQSSSSLRSTIAPTSLALYSYRGQSSAHIRNICRSFRRLGNLNGASKKRVQSSKMYSVRYLLQLTHTLGCHAERNVLLFSLFLSLSFSKFNLCISNVSSFAHIHAGKGKKVVKIRGLMVLRSPEIT